jgi:hypothetical protein
MLGLGELNELITKNSSFFRLKSNIKVEQNPKLLELINKVQYRKKSTTSK